MNTEAQGFGSCNFLYPPGEGLGLRISLVSVSIGVHPWLNCGFQVETAVALNRRERSKRRGSEGGTQEGRKAREDARPTEEGRGARGATELRADAAPDLVGEPGFFAQRVIDVVHGFLPLRGKRQGEGRALARLTRGFDPAAVLVDDEKAAH
jgi:hypothetical protein